MAYSRSHLLSPNLCQILDVHSGVLNLADAELSLVVNKRGLHGLAHHYVGVAEQGVTQVDGLVSAVGQNLLDNHRVVHVG